MDPVRIAALYSAPPISVNNNSNTGSDTLRTMQSATSTRSSFHRRRVMVRGLSSSSSMYSEYTYDDGDNDTVSQYDDDADVEDYDDADVDDEMRVDDENSHAWLPPLVIPGPFVVLQGSAGDGMANTIQTCPELPPLERRNRNNCSAARRGQANVLATTTDEDSSFHHVARPPPPLGHLATSTANNPFAGRGVMSMPTTNVSPAPANNNNIHPTSVDQASYASSSSYVVVVTDQDDYSHQEEDGSVHSGSQGQDLALSAANAQAIAQWKEKCQETEVQQHQDWRESLHQVPARMHDHVLMTTENRWWQPDHNHHVAILRDIPTKLNNGNVLRTVIGSLPPGTTLIARDIVHLDSKTLQRLPVLPQRLLEERDNGGDVQRLVCGRGQKGVIQLVQVETPEGRAGFAVLSLDGYSLLAPGLPQQYIDPQLWMWRVSCPAGAYVREGLDLSTQHRDTIPFGSLVRVTRRCINNQGLSRLRTIGWIPDSSSLAQESQSQVPPMKMSSSENEGTEERHVDGWCSELLNPLSGQRGIIVQPLPFPVPAIYRVVFKDG
jgi:hypothetical protein